jgi:hypothetical protein
MNSTIKSILLIATFVIGAVVISIESQAPRPGLTKAIIRHYVLPNSIMSSHGRNMRGTVAITDSGDAKADEGDSNEDGSCPEWVEKGHCNECCSNQCTSATMWMFQACKRGDEIAMS